MDGDKYAATDVKPGERSEHRKWTVMVFMGADSIEGNAPLLDAAEADLLEMRSVGSGEALNVFVQVHGKGPVPRRGHHREHAEGNRRTRSCP